MELKVKDLSTMVVVFLRLVYRRVVSGEILVGPRQRDAKGEGRHLYMCTLLPHCQHQNARQWNDQQREPLNGFIKGACELDESLKKMSIHHRA